MKKFITVLLSITLITPISFTFFCATNKKYYAKFIPVDYSNWVWQEIPYVTSCTKTQDGLQYIIKYKGTSEPRIRQGKSTVKETEYNLTMTIGVDNILIYKYKE